MDPSPYQAGNTVVDNRPADVGAKDRETVALNISQDNYLNNTDYTPETNQEILFQYNPDTAPQSEQNSSGEDKNQTGQGLENSTDEQNFRLLLAERVEKSGKFNYQGLQIMLPTKWNIQLLDKLLTGYHDKEIINFLKFGWPVDRDLQSPSA